MGRLVWLSCLPSGLGWAGLAVLLRLAGLAGLAGWAGWLSRGDGLGWLSPGWLRAGLAELVGWASKLARPSPSHSQPSQPNPAEPNPAQSCPAQPIDGRPEKGNWENAVWFSPFGDFSSLHKNSLSNGAGVVQCVYTPRPRHLFIKAGKNGPACCIRPRVLIPIVGIRYPWRDESSFEGRAS